MGKLSFLPAAVGFLLGIGFLLLLDEITPHMHMDNQSEGPRSKLKRTTKLILAVTLHNIPEGMAVGVVYAGWASGQVGVSQTAALALALGIAIQNFPEGAIVSMPLRAEGMPKGKTFLYGALSGIVEPIASIITILAAGLVVPISLKPNSDITQVSGRTASCCSIVRSKSGIRQTSTIMASLGMIAGRSTFTAVKR